MRPLLSLLLVAAACAAARPSAPASDPRLQTLLQEAVRFPTIAGAEEAHRAQRAWLLRTAKDLGLEARDAGPVTEVELPGPPGAPVLGLVVHGDVQPVEPKGWSVPPFAGVVRDEAVWGRGAADDKGPMVQALLALHALRGERLTHTVRLLVGSDEESGSSDMAEYLKTHAPPDYSLVLDSGFPVVVGEKGWEALAIAANEAERAPTGAFRAVELTAGIAPSIVPEEARLTLAPRDGRGDFRTLEEKLKSRTPDRDTRLELVHEGENLVVVVHGHAAHAGVSLESGRNALVSLAHLVDGLLPPSGLSDLLAYAALAGGDPRGSGLGLPARAAPGWGGYDVNVAQVTRDSARIAPQAKGRATLIINIRRPPPVTGPEDQAWQKARLADFCTRTGARLELVGGFFGDEPLVFDREAKLVKQLAAVYARVTGRHDELAVSGGGTYAKRIPNAIAFGMWFPGKPYPGHSADERIPVADLQAGYDVLVAAIRELGSGPRLEHPFQP